MGVGKEITERIRAKNMLSPDALVGVRGMNVKADVQGDGRTLEFVATTDDIDSDMEVVVPSGADPSKFQRNGNVFVNHQYRVEDIVGKLRSLTPFSRMGANTGWKMAVYMVRGNEIADGILAIAEAGGIGASIGFMARDRGRPTADEVKKYTQGSMVPESIVRKWEWFETSIVGIPCNINCQTQAMQVLDQRMADLDMLLTKGKITRRAAEAFGLETKVTKTMIRRAPTIVRSIS